KVGSAHATVLGGSEGGMIALLFAATFPDRVSALVLYGTTAKFLADKDYPWGMSIQNFKKALKMAETWGTGQGSVPVFAPSEINDRALITWAAKFERMCATPAQFREYLYSIARLDLRDVLPKISVPTLVLHRCQDRAVNIGHARFISSVVNGARLVELDG